jgi:hypothetical protein
VNRSDEGTANDEKKYIELTATGLGATAGLAGFLHHRIKK